MSTRPAAERRVAEPVTQRTGRAATLTRPQRMWFLVVSSLLAALLLVGGAELILRLKGVHPWRPGEGVVRISPGGTFFSRHPTLGYSHIPGSFTITLATDYSFHVTHLPNTLRITHPLDTYGGASRKGEIWIFGCSLTHGWSLNDEETYPWVLQQQFPEYEVVNFGVSGYGTVHSLLQFRHALESRRPNVAVLAYADFHDERNTFLRNRQKAIVPWNKLGPLVQPYARLDGTGHVRYSMARVEYSEFPLMRYLALAHYVEERYDQLEDRFYRSHAVSEALVKEMAMLARQHDVTFVVAGISASPVTLAMLHFTQANGIPSVDIAVDPRAREYRNLPYDPHPSALAAKKYADTLGAYLRAGILQ